MTALIGIVCDGCGLESVRKTYRQMSATDIRDTAKTHGWHKTKGLIPREGLSPVSYARDICPECWAGGKR